MRRIRPTTRQRPLDRSTDNGAGGFRRSFSVVLTILATCFAITGIFLSSSVKIRGHSDGMPAALSAASPTANVSNEAADGHYTMFFQAKMCHPGFKQPDCVERLVPANPFYTADCLNLQDHGNYTLWPLNDKVDNTLSIQDLGGRTGCVDPKDSWGRPFVCAYLCYSHEEYGVPVVPQTIWRAAQEAEGGVWKSMGGSNHDRAPEHVEAFGEYQSLLNRQLGDVIEVGAGPWTQTRFLLQAVPSVESTVSSFTVYEPGAESYIKDVKSCAYNDRTSLLSADRRRKHGFPLHILGTGGETLLDHDKQYDTLVSINVVEHVQSSYVYLQGLHRVLKPGGLLIFHDRSFSTPRDGNCALGNNYYHPIRLTPRVFEIFLDQFEEIYLSTKQNSFMKKRKCNEHPYYFVGIKK